MKLVFGCLIVILLEACTLLDPKTKEWFCKMDMASGVNCKLRF